MKSILLALGLALPLLVSSWTNANEIDYSEFSGKVYSKSYPGTASGPAFSLVIVAGTNYPIKNGSTNAPVGACRYFYTQYSHWYSAKDLLKLLLSGCEAESSYFYNIFTREQISKVYQIDANNQLALKPGQTSILDVTPGASSEISVDAQDVSSLIDDLSNKNNAVVKRVLAFYQLLRINPTPFPLLALFDVIREEEPAGTVSYSGSSSPKYNEIRGLKAAIIEHLPRPVDARTYTFLSEILEEGRYSYLHDAIIATYGATSTNDIFNHAMIKAVYSGNQQIARALYKAYPKSDKELEALVYNELSTRTFRGTDELKACFSAYVDYDAITVALKYNYKTLLLPILDVLRTDETCLHAGSKDPNASVQWAFGKVFTYLDTLRDERALSVLTLGDYLHAPNIDLQNRVANSIKKIEQKQKIDAITKGNRKAIEWGMEFISTVNGVETQTTLEIISAYRKAIRLYPSIKNELKKFIQEEINSGYHDFNKDVIKAMNEFVASYH